MMRDTLRLRVPFVFLVLFFIPVQHIHAYSLRQYSSKNGLSNSAILSMGQDKNGFVWFGSCDGLNMFDGVNFQIYKPTDSKNNLSGNLIESILVAEDDILWVQTNYGLDRFDSRKRTIQTFKEFKGKNKLILSPDNDLYVVKEDNYIYYYEPSQEVFLRVYVENLVFEDILEMSIDSEDVLWIFMMGGVYRSYSVTRNESEVSLVPRNYFTHDEVIVSCFYDENTFYFVDTSHGLYEYDVITKNTYYIKDISAEIEKYGDISSIIKHRGDFFIGFRTSGLIRLQNTPEMKNRFIVHEVSIKSGIFCLMKDRYQDIVWVGTDGQGVYMYFIDQYSVKSTLFNEIKHPVNNPVRALYIDKEHTLWIGTKGDGIVRMFNYNPIKNESESSEQILTSNSDLKDNSVYVFAPSAKNILWIGSENGINYYSYKERKIKDIEVSADGKPVKYVHSICELNDSTLWIATVGEGVIKATLAGKPDEPQIVSTQRFVFDGGKRASNYFFTTFQENDSIVWLGNRGYGAYRINNNTHEVRTLTFDENDTNQTLNDVFSIAKTDEGYWFGTSYGLAHLRADDGKKEIFNEANGFPNNTIHGILQDRRDNLWLSTNQGIVKFNTSQNTFQTYKQQNELEVTEFSDGAYFKDEQTGVLLMGGINGFITIQENNFSQTYYEPDIQFNQLSIFGKEYNINDFLDSYHGEPVLKLKYSQNFFSVAFTAVDYINGNNYTYLYKLNELSDNWIENGVSNRASFTNISPGNYKLQVKYRSNITGNESKVQSLTIRILPPWYRTNLAYFIYMLLIMLVLAAIARFSLKWYRLKRDNMIEKLNQQQREEVYESKLRFFTNITHELCTPLTLISGPCEKIIEYSKTDKYINKYASLIQHNAEKLNGLIQELIEFRRLETGNKKADIRQISVSDLVRSIAESFSELAETKGYDYQIHIAENVYWNSDSSCLTKIVTNLISNAFKYTFENGKVLVDLYVKEKQLHIVVSNTGKGIKEENISKIFDRYTVLDNFEDQSKKGDSPRNGLGLAICNNMVKLLEGEINVTSTLNELTVFTVVLPQLIVNMDEPEGIIINNDTPPLLMKETVQVAVEKNNLLKFDKNKQTIMVIDDDPSMLWFVTEIFSDRYNVMSINDPEEVMGALKMKMPDLIISDVMMPGIDGISLTKLIKEDKLINHIPLILLSAKNDIDEQVKGIDSGAEVYITKPFNVQYLEKIVERLIQRKEDLKEYYTSVFSAVEVSDGKVVHKEDKDFLEKVLQKIDDNVSNPELSVELLGSYLGLSTRQLYRKLKNITEKTPNDIIKEYRLNLAEKLLVTTNLSVDEILYKAGFANRGSFFKLFSQKYGMTPKNFREQKKKEFQDVLSS